MRVIAALAVAAVSGCGVHVSTGESSTLTPQQSRAQVLDAGAEIAATLNLPVLRAVFWHASCNDQGRAPFRGQLRISYPPAASRRESEIQIAAMITRLTATGWSADPDFHSHSPAVRKNGVTAVFRGQNASVASRAIEVIGQCRDVTTATESIPMGFTSPTFQSPPPVPGPVPYSQPPGTAGPIGKARS